MTTSLGDLYEQLRTRRRQLHQTGDAATLMILHADIAQLERMIAMRQRPVNVVEMAAYRAAAYGTKVA